MDLWSALLTDVEMQPREVEETPVLGGTVSGVERWRGGLGRRRIEVPGTHST